MSTEPRRRGRQAEAQRNNVRTLNAAREVFIANPAAPAPPLQVASRGGSGQLSRPAVDGNVLMYAIATTRGSRVVQRVLGTRKRRLKGKCK